MIAGAAAAGAALSWGAADFCGGKASKSATSPAVVMISQLSSLPLLAGFLLLTPDAWPTVSDLAWGFVAGLSGAVGLILLYRGLATAAMSVVAPVTGVTAAVVPVGVGLALDRAPGTLALIGVGCALAAIALVTVAPRGGEAAPSLQVVSLALIAGVGFGLFFVLLAHASPDSGLWPLVGVRTASLVLSGALVWQANTSLRLRGTPLAWAFGAGALDITANGLYLAATYLGVLTVVAPVASLYPVSTVLLALLIDRESVRPAQLAGIGLAAAALVLVQMGTG